MGLMYDGNAASPRREPRASGVVSGTVCSPLACAAGSPERPARALAFGPLQLASRYLLSPLAGYTNMPFRLAVRALGGLGLATTDLVNARALLRASRKTLELIDTCPEDRPVAVQIYGTDGAEMADAARWLEDYGASSVDINMGCPV